MENKVNSAKQDAFYILKSVPKDTCKAIRSFVYFLAFMVVLTLLSNGMNGITIAKVTAVYPAPAIISDEITVVGTITAASKQIVSAPEDLPVEKVIANIGGKVQKGDVLLIFNVAEISDQLQKKQADLEKLEAEVYANQVILQRTDMLDSEQDMRQLEAAEKEYQNIQEKTKITIERAEHEYEEANRAYTRARVDYRNSGNSADVMSAMMRLDQAETQLEEARVEYDRKLQIYNTAIANHDPTQTAARQEMEEAKKKYLSADKKYQLALDRYDDAVAESDDEDFGGNTRQDYENLRSLRNRVYDAKNALEEAKLEQNREIEDALRKIREQENRNEISEITRENERQNQKIEQIQDSAKQKALLLEIEQIKKDCAVLTGFLESEGKLYAPEDGILIELHMNENRILSGKEAIQIATSSEGYQIPLRLDSKSVKDVTVASKAQANISGKKIEIELTSIATYPDEDDKIAVMAKLPEGSYQEGLSSEVIIQKKQAQYNTCIPLGALRNDNDGDFIFLLDESKTILGIQVTLRRVPVEVEMKDDKMAALSGAIDSRSQILMTSNKMVESGDRVRLMET